MEGGLTKQKIIAELSKSPHGKLDEYIVVGQQATRQEPEFFAHLIAWDRVKGQIRDAKVALPIISLSLGTLPADLAENSLAHLTLLNPRELLRAYRFALQVKLPYGMRTLRRLIAAYLHDKEGNWPRFERTALQHRAVLKELYALTHTNCGSRAQAVLYGYDRKTKQHLPYPSGSLFEMMAHLKDMTPAEAAGTIIERKIPFLIARGALGAKAKEPDLVLALLKRMTPNEVVNNTKALQSMGVKTNPALRGAFEEALKRTASSTSNVLKASTAAEAIEDEDVKEKLRGVQERQIQKLGGVEGNWLVLGDKSGSMAECIEVARHVAATLAKMVKGKVWLTFFDTMPTTIDVTGLPLDTIAKATRHITANGGTSIGCGLQRMLNEKEIVDGIAIISDAQENTAPLFAGVYRNYAQLAGKDVPVYLFRLQHGRSGWDDRDLAVSMRAANYDLQEFDLRGGKVDYYSLPNLVQTMRTNQYSLIDEIMSTKLLTLRDVFKQQAVAHTA